MDLNQVTLPCLELDASVRFYERLGLRLIVLSPPDYARFECDSGATFSLHTVPHEFGASGVIVYFEVEALDTTVEKLRSGGVVFETLPKDQPWLWREAYLKDPAGNTLCLYHAGSNRRHPPWRIG